MIAYLKTEAEEGLAQVFNLIEHAGLATRLGKAMYALHRKHGAAYEAALQCSLPVCKTL